MIFPPVSYCTDDEIEGTDSGERAAEFGEGTGEKVARRIRGIWNSRDLGLIVARLLVQEVLAV
jgi:hypothetical protein